MAVTASRPRTAPKAGPGARLRPDAVLLDLGLPYRSGATVLQEIKLDPQTRTSRW